MSEDLKQQDAHCGSTYHLINNITVGQRKRGKYWVLIIRPDFGSDLNKRWGPLASIRVDVARVLETLLHSSADRNIKQETLDLLFQVTI